MSTERSSVIIGVADYIPITYIGRGARRLIVKSAVYK